MMNFSHFGSHFSAAIPNIHQFAAKFSQENLVSNTVISPTQDTNPVRYSSNGLTTFAQHHSSLQQNAFTATIKYPNNYVNQQSNIYTQQAGMRNDKRNSFDQQELANEICAAVLQQEEKNSSQKVKQEVLQDRIGQNPPQMQQNNAQNQSTTSVPSSWQSLATPGSTVADYLSHLPASTLPLSLHHFLKYSAENLKKETSAQHMVQNHDTNINLLQNNMINSNQLSNTVNTAMLNTSINNLSTNIVNNTLATINTNPFQSISPNKKKKKRKVEKEKKPRPMPGEIRLTTALDGSTLYCCPECHMAYPEKELLEQHLLGHTLERRFVCDICGAGLKRKDHLTRHKQSHNPERPYVCTVCLKAFKRKEQLTLHFVIHSGEKRHICTECGKGFYRKDHLRKHTRSHIARRVKAELSQQGSISTLTQNHGISS